MPSGNNFYNLYLFSPRVPASVTSLPACQWMQLSWDGPRQILSAETWPTKGQDTLKLCESLFMFRRQILHTYTIVVWGFYIHCEKQAHSVHTLRSHSCTQVWWGSRCNLVTRGDVRWDAQDADYTRRGCITRHHQRWHGNRSPTSAASWPQHQGQA